MRRLTKGFERMDRFRSLENESILLVENDPTIRETLTAAFSRIGCRVKGFDSAEAGLVEFQNHRFSVVISDFKLPGMDGLTFFREVLTQNDNIVTVLISGFADNETVFEARKIRVDAVLEKPFTLESLFTVLQEKIEGRKTANGLSGYTFGPDTEAPTTSERSEKTKGGYGGKVLQTSLSNEDEEKLQKALADTTSAPAATDA